MSFTPSTHEFVGTDKNYSPIGCMPYMPPAEFGTPGNGAILYPGERVTVLSAWERDYLPASPILLYVESHGTGQRTHIVADDLRGAL